jgi:hypothetical protein
MVFFDLVLKQNDFLVDHLINQRYTNIETRILRMNSVNLRHR